MDTSANDIASTLRQALQLRRRYACLAKTVEVSDGPVEFAFEPDGLVHLYDGQGKSLFEVPSLANYYDDMETIFRARSSGPISSYCYQRLRLLQTKFELYSMLSGDAEVEQVARTGHRDFYNVRKVDTHVHHSAAMTAKHLLRFMKKKLKHFSGDVVSTDKDGKPRTLKDVFGAMGVDWADLCIDRLQVWADKSCLHRFDRFNNKYSPLGHNDLRTIFLKTENAMGGRYLAELTRELMDDLEESKYQHAEWRLSIYGRARNEWHQLSLWVLGEGKGLGDGQALLSPNVRWMIQIPRLYSLYKSTGHIENFGDMLEHIFVPMFEATIDPASSPQVARFLEQVSGFDTVDDESKSENPVSRTFSSKELAPREWNIADNPSYKYYSYYIHANLSMLNRLRARRGLNQFSYRPHAGEAGEVHHLDTAFLLADGINHGINLRKAPVLQYLFYLARIGVAMSPCSNNQLFLAYDKNPFPTYFARGLNVSLSTDDPLMFHQTKEPLMEEYSIAKQIWHFTSVDLCEMARNSVLQSGFLTEQKALWLGAKNFLEENMVQSTNIPDLRMSFREETYREELNSVYGDNQVGSPRATADSKRKDSHICRLLLSSNGSRPTLSPAVRTRVNPLPSEENEVGTYGRPVAEKEEEQVDEQGWGSSRPHATTMEDIRGIFELSTMRREVSSKFRENLSLPALLGASALAGAIGASITFALLLSFSRRK
mmetsp:Transcript_62035/g.134577  ORF Transcript_62035/g.134577 Transcript_62035/m.134577 type:complete len:713 (-) Transcript_62035:37-2175(-)